MVHNVELIEVIHVVTTTGKGVPGDPVRQLDQYWSKGGQLLAERDSLPVLQIPDATKNSQ